MAVRSAARKRLLDPAAASLAMNVSWEYAAAAQPLVVHERNVEGTYLQPVYFWSPVYSAPDVGSAAITDEQLLSTLQPPTAGASDPSHAHRCAVRLIESKPRCLMYVELWRWPYSFACRQTAAGVVEAVANPKFAVQPVQEICCSSLQT
jgi:hypothetical protein